MRIATLLFFSCLHLIAEPQKVAIMGDSITWGVGAKARENNRYSSRIDHLLGKDYEVKTFAASSLCMLRKADQSFVKTKLFQQALAFQPDIAVITLGTNDTSQNTRYNNWQHSAQLQADTQYFIDALRKVNPKVIIHLCSPPPIFPNQPGLKPERKKDLLKRSKRILVIQQTYADVAKRNKGVHYHDITRSLRPNETTDGIHPHTFGHERLAHHYREIIVQPTGQRVPVDKVSGTSSSWHGFDRHDFKLPRTGAQCSLVIPHTAAQGQPWIWRARFFGHQPALDLALLDRGYHLAYVDVSHLFGSPEAIKRADEFYQVLTAQFNLSQKAIMEGMSRGGLLIFNYAAQFPKRVAAIYGDNPVCDFKSWPGGKSGKPSPTDWNRCLKAWGITATQAATHPQITDVAFCRQLARYNIPVALVLGTEDQVVPAAENGELFASRYADAGGKIKVWRKPGLGHHPHGLSPVDPLLRFLLRTDGRVANPAIIASPSSEYRSGAGWGGHWWQAFDHLKKQVAHNRDAKYVFIGDSITQGLTGHNNRASSPNGRRAIDRYYGKPKTLSLGLSGDRTEHILWRLNHGLLNDIQPSHLVLMIGVNNINARGHSGEEIAAGTKAIVTWLKHNKPNTKVLLLGCFPTQRTADHPARAEVNSLHRLIRPLADKKTVFYQDLRPLFLNPDGTLNGNMSGDAIHINGRGKEAWMKAIQPFFAK